MNLVQQPPRSFQCGQCCVAMVAGVTRKKSIKAFGTKGVTTTKSVIRAFKRLGYTANAALKTFRRQEALPAVCLLRLRYENRHYQHWVVYCEGLIYCPGLGIYPYAQLLEQAGTTCTSYLGVAPST